MADHQEGGRRSAADGHRVVAMLRRLAELTSDEQGAQRVAWTRTWQQARDFLREQLLDLPVTVRTDPAGNMWARLPGGDGRAVIVGSHLDSVPSGGWLDGAYGVMCALETLRVLATWNSLPCPVVLVDWADEEGARFGMSLFGSSAAAGTLDAAVASGLADASGRLLPDVLAEHGVLLDQLEDARLDAEGVHAYMEAHIEQGPVLDRQGLPVAAVSGTVGVERHRVTFQGQTSHSGSTPMDTRRDAFLAAAKTALAVRESAVHHRGVGTVGSSSLHPGIVTAVPGIAVILIDQRHPQAASLQAMLSDVRKASREAAAAEGCTVTWERIFQANPQPFADDLVGVVRRTCAELTGIERELPSWALHDATQMAAVVPTAMLFTSSIGGLSHTKEEDTPEAHLQAGAECFHRAVCQVILQSGKAQAHGRPT